MTREDVENAWSNEDVTITCSDCKWHQLGYDIPGWVCTHEKSETYGEWTDFSESCDLWEG